MASHRSASISESAARVSATFKTPLEGVRNFAERLRELVSIHPFSTDGNDIEVTISLGLAELPEYMHEPDQLIQAADANLYAAKDAGRNTSAG